MPSSRHPRRRKRLSSSLHLRQALGRDIKALWSEAQPRNLALLTFNDLEVGDKFIIYPEPNKRLSYSGAVLFIKYREEYQLTHPHGENGEIGSFFAISLFNGEKFSFIHETAVLKIVDHPTSA